MKIFEEKGYKYQKHLSTGGEGEIHLIRSVDKFFVAKILPKLDSSTYELLESLSSFDIPNIPRIYELFNYDDKTVIIRDYIEGTTLYDLMKNSTPFEYTKVKSIIIKICDTLKALHNVKPHPIIYRDLKPENIIITPHNEVRLIDFGIARYYKKESTRDTVLAGTRGYTAPEVLAGMQSDNRSDIYSVGLLFYEMLTGKNMLMPPFQIRPVKESNENLEKCLDTIIAKATDFNQTNRYNSIEEFVYDLESPNKINRKKNRRLALLIACAALFLSVIGFAVYKLLTPSLGEDYSIVLDLEFDDEEDTSYIVSVEERDSEFSFKDEKLFVEKGMCAIDFEFQRGMIAHYKIRGSSLSSVSVGPYIVNVSSHFDCILYNKEEDSHLGVFGLTLEGSSIIGTMEYIDVLLYIPAVDNAVYIMVIQDSHEAIAYTSYKVPHQINEMLIMDISNSAYDEDGFMHVESVKVIEGSLNEYIKDNFSSYNKNKKLINEFLEQDVNSIPELILESIDTMP